MNFDAFEKKVKDLGVLGIVVTKGGKEIGKKLWDEQCRRNVYSASKSFTSTAVGIAVKEGLLSLDEKLVACFDEDLPENVSENLAKATVKDLLTMCLGQEKAELMGAQRPVYEEEDWVKMSLALPFVYEPDVIWYPTCIRDCSNRWASPVRPGNWIPMVMSSVLADFT